MPIAYCLLSIARGPLPVYTPLPIAYCLHAHSAAVWTQSLNLCAKPK